MKRVPIGRLCTLIYTCTSWPDNGAGIWQVYGYVGKSHIELRRIAPAQPGGPSGELIRVSLRTASEGMRVWRKDLIDPAFKPKP